jgi:hypothetical protein
MGWPLRFSFSEFCVRWPKLDTDDISLHRYDENAGEWNELDTEVVDESDGEVTYESITLLVAQRECLVSVEILDKEFVEPLVCFDFCSVEAVTDDMFERVWWQKRDPTAHCIENAVSWRRH